MEQNHGFSNNGYFSQKRLMIEEDFPGHFKVRHFSWRHFESRVALKTKPDVDIQTNSKKLKFETLHRWECKRKSCFLSQILKMVVL